MTNKEILKGAIGGYCEYKTTKEIGLALGISTAKAYKICVEQEAAGWLGCLGFAPYHCGGAKMPASWLRDFGFIDTSGVAEIAGADIVLN